MIYQKATINLKNIDDKCYEHGYTLTQHHTEIPNHPEQVSNIEPFTDLYNCDGIKNPAVLDNNNQCFI